MARDPARSGALLRGWLALSTVVGPVARLHLRRRLKRGKEDPARFREKLGEASAPRPEGALIWMHAVGVGEVLALPGLAARLMAAQPGVRVLITSSSRTSAEAVAPNLPEGVIHQYLPLDARPFVRAFLDHWRPDVSVWAERDIWPALVVETARRGIPMALINGKMNAASFRAKRRAGGLFRDLYARFAFVGAQDAETAAHFRAFGVAEDRLRVTGSLKASAPPLADQRERREELENALQDRRVWIAASTHPGEEEIVAEAHARLRLADPSACLIVAPRDPKRAAEVAQVLQARGVPADVLPADNRLPGQTAAYVVARIGQLGLWYRIADTAFVGGSLVPVGGHNPYEPARLGCAVLHGRDVGNFAEDYAAFHAADAAREVSDAAALLAALTAPDLDGLRVAAADVAERGHEGAEMVAARILSLLEGGRG